MPQKNENDANSQLAELLPKVQKSKPKLMKVTVHIDDSNYQKLLILAKESATPSNEVNNLLKSIFITGLDTLSRKLPKPKSPPKEKSKPVETPNLNAAATLSTTTATTKS